MHFSRPITRPEIQLLPAVSRKDKILRLESEQEKKLTKNKLLESEEGRTIQIHLNLFFSKKAQRCMLAFYTSGSETAEWAKDFLN